MTTFEINSCRVLDKINYVNSELEMLFIEHHSNSQQVKKKSFEKRSQSFT